MAKLSKEELIKKIDSMELDEERKIELIEDVTDSFENEDSEMDDYKEKYENLAKKYKERFMQGEEKEEKIEIDEPEEKEVIDIKEI